MNTAHRIPHREVPRSENDELCRFGLIFHLGPLSLCGKVMVRGRQRAPGARALRPPARRDGGGRRVGVGLPPRLCSLAHRVMSSPVALSQV